MLPHPSRSSALTRQRSRSQRTTLSAGETRLLDRQTPREGASPGVAAAAGTRSRTRTKCRVHFAPLALVWGGLLSPPPLWGKSHLSGLSLRCRTGLWARSCPAALPRPLGARSLSRRTRFLKVSPREARREPRTSSRRHGEGAALEDSGRDGQRQPERSAPRPGTAPTTRLRSPLTAPRGVKGRAAPAPLPAPLPRRTEVAVVTGRVAGPTPTCGGGAARQPPVPQGNPRPAPPAATSRPAPPDATRRALLPLAAATRPR